MRKNILWEQYYLCETMQGHRLIALESAIFYWEHFYGLCEECFFLKKDGIN